LDARAAVLLLAGTVFTLSCRSTQQPASRPSCGADHPIEAATPPDYIIRVRGPFDSTGHAVGQGGVVVRLVDGPTQRPVAGARVQLSAGAHVFVPADRQMPDTDGIHPFGSIPAGHYVVRIASVGYQLQTVPHDVRSGGWDTLTVTFLRGPLCLSH
jgi:hypothetical protein